MSYTNTILRKFWATEFVQWKFTYFVCSTLVGLMLYTMLNTARKQHLNMYERG